MREKEISEGLGELADIAERDHEVQMARADLYKSAKYAIKLHEMLKGVSEAEGLEGWVQSKITKASEMLGSVYHHMDYEESGLADEAVVVGEAKDTHCSDKCCGSDVKREDCTCPPTCKHCNCNATNESTNEGPFKGVGKTLMKRKLKKQYKKSDLANFDDSGIDTSGKSPDEVGQMKSDYYHDNMDKAARAKKAGDRLSRKKESYKEGLQARLENAQPKMDVTDADKNANTPAYKRMKAGDKRYNDKTTKDKKTTEGTKKFKSSAHRKAVHAAKASGKR
jgi:hypothetical protein